MPRSLPVSQVIGWKLDALDAQAMSWMAQSDKLKTELDAVQNNSGNSADYIVGKFGNGLRTKASSVRDEGYKVAGVLRAACGAILTRLGELQLDQESVSLSKTLITGEGYLVGEDGGVTLSLSQVASALSDRDNAALKLGALQRQADEYTRSLRSLLADAGLHGQIVVNGLNAAFADLPGGGNGTTPVQISGASGQDLGTKVKNSDQIPADVLAQIDQVLDRTGLSADDLARLHAGETVDVPASTLEFTQKFLDAAGPDGFAKLSEQLRAQGPDGQTHARELANSVMLLSNEKVKGIRTDGKQTTGGYEQLPQAYRAIISSRVLENPNDQRAGNPGFLPDANTNKYPDPDGIGQFRAGTKYYGTLTRMTTALDGADSSYTPGTKLSTELYRQGGTLATMLNANHEGKLNLPADGALLEKSLTNIVDIGSRNTDATAIILTGEGTPDQLGANYHRDSTVVALVNHDWPGGVENSPIHQMFDWIPENAQVHLSPTDPGYQHQLDQSTLAGKSARALADVLSTTKSPDGINNFKSLFDHKDNGMRYVAGALSPYVSNMVGVNENLTGTHGFGNLNPVEATRVFTLLDGDKHAAAIINGAAIAQSYEFDRAFARGEGGNELALYSGRLHGLIEGGIAADAGLHNMDAEAAGTHRKELLGASFLSAKEIFNAGAKEAFKFIPGERFVMPVVNSLEAYLKDPTVNALYDKPTLAYPTVDTTLNPYVHKDTPGFQQIPERADAAQRYVMLQARVDSGQLDPSTLPHELLTDHGTLRTFDDVDDIDAAKIPAILEGNGMDPHRLVQYEGDAASGSRTVRAAVFGGELVEPGNKLFGSVLQAGGVPDQLNRWGKGK